MSNTTAQPTGAGNLSAVHNVTDRGWFDTVKNLPHGEWLSLSDKPNAKVWRKGSYDNSARGYWIDDCSDMSHGKLVKGSRLVFVGFTY